MTTLRTKLDANQVLRDSFDENAGRLRVDAEVTASIGTVDVIIDASSGDNLAIADQTGTNYLNINPDGSIDANVKLDAADGDSVKISDGVDSLAVNTDGSINVVNVDGASEATLQNLLTELQQKTEPTDAQNIRALDSSTDSVEVVATSLPLPTGAATEDTLQDVLTQLQSPLEIQALVATEDNVLTAGTINGQSNGQVFYNVNNVRQQVLSTHDRIEVATYTDLGLKTQRITEINYTSPTFPGVTVKKAVNWVFDGKFYVYSGSVWSIL